MVGAVREIYRVPDIAQYLNFLRYIFSDCKHMAMCLQSLNIENVLQSLKQENVFIKGKKKIVKKALHTIRLMYQEQNY